MRRRIAKEVWEQARTAFASGIGLRELARNMEIPEGTMLARASRERWSQQVDSAKQLVPVQQSSTITPMQSAAITMQQRGERYVGRMAGVAESVLPHLEAMQPSELLESVHEVEKFDRIARRTYGIDDGQKFGGVLNLSILTNQAAVQVIGSSS